jgi:di/tripeptidase
LRNRTIGKLIYLNEGEAAALSSHAKRAGLSEAAYVRTLIRGYVPKEKPDDRFYAALRELSAIGNNVNQLARKAAALGFVDVPFYKREAEKWDAFRMEVKRKFLLPDKEVNEKLP